MTDFLYHSYLSTLEELAYHGVPEAGNRRAILAVSLSWVVKEVPPPRAKARPTPTPTLGQCTTYNGELFQVFYYPELNIWGKDFIKEVRYRAEDVREKALPAQHPATITLQISKAFVDEKKIEFITHLR